LILSSHGSDFEKIQATHTLWAELKWVARHEQVIHLDDLLLRRTRIGSLLPQGALPIMHQIREICQPQLGWDDSRWQAEVLDYQRLYAQSYSLPQSLTA
jgi:glycerol-3-phosphate dehydrogenase